jgi:hypothetical protein
VPPRGGLLRHPSMAVGQTLPQVIQVRSRGDWMPIGVLIGNLGISPLLDRMNGFFPQLAAGSSVAAPAPGSSGPVPPVVQSGNAVGSAAGSGSGFFFGGAALLAMVGWFLPRVICTLRMFGASRAPQPFVLLLERPG